MPDRPNFLILMSDQHNPHVLGCNGDGVVRTPNLDSLAERREHHGLLRNWYRSVQPPDREHWDAPDDANAFP